MERLTSNNTLTETESMNLSLTDLYTRLKAYEDIGLTPEDLKKKLRTLRHYEDKFGDRPAKRWDELCNAEDQGRLIVLPCNVGDRVYALFWGRKDGIVHICCPCGEFNGMKSCAYLSTKGKVSECTAPTLDRSDGIRIGIYSQTFTFSMRNDVGKTVFLSREEAEKALEGMK